MSNFWQAYDHLVAAAAKSEVGKVMVAAGYHVAHTGGGCMTWEKTTDTHYFWICDEGNGLGDSLDENYMVGIYTNDGELVNEGDTVEGVQAALQWMDVHSGFVRD